MALVFAEKRQDESLFVRADPFVTREVAGKSGGTWHRFAILADLLPFAFFLSAA
jgi:hypothetical protein